VCALAKVLHSADAVFGALSRVLGEAAQLADATPDVFMFAVRLAVSVMELACLLKWRRLLFSG
jgi:hypothetical protein